MWSWKSLKACTPCGEPIRQNAWECRSSGVTMSISIGNWIPEKKPKSILPPSPMGGLSPWSFRICFGEITSAVAWTSLAYNGCLTAGRVREDRRPETEVTDVRCRERGLRACFRSLGKENKLQGAPEP